MSFICHMIARLISVLGCTGSLFMEKEWIESLEAMRLHKADPELLSQTSTQNIIRFMFWSEYTIHGVAHVGLVE